MLYNGRIKTLLYLTVFSAAMAYLESAVVVYLRELYYPSGFDFPMVALPGRIALTEILREAATLVMLITVACLAANNGLTRFAWFLYCFAVWDIFYYIYLKLLIGWPASLLTWDILFLIPVVWAGPVIAPVVVSITMILLSLQVIFSTKKYALNMRWLILLGAFAIFLAFIWDFSAFMLKQYSLSALFRSDLSFALQHYIPGHFNWWILLAGELMILYAILYQTISRANAGTK
jgi:hypothetical protein